MATTEEMNVTIAQYAGWELKETGTLYKHHELIGDIYMHPSDCTYDKDWNALLKVWGKLQQDINNTLYNEYGKCLDKNFETTVFEELKDNIIHVDITEAHRLIYEAITWLNQNKEK